MKWLILGAGRSGFGAQRLLQHHGIQSVIFDENKLNLDTRVREGIIDNPNHPIFFEQDLSIVISPGFAPDHPVLERARNLNHEVLTEVDLALSYYTGQVIAVTGTNGKSTTVMMIGHLLTQLGYDSVVGGNIGVAATTLMIDEHSKYLVLELSSYQIEASKLLRPVVAVLTGITPDHLQRHKTIRGYLAAKWPMFAKQGVHDFAIIEESAIQQALTFGLPRPKAKLTVITEQGVKSIAPLLKFRWQHDQMNALMALQTASVLSGRSLVELAPLLHNFKGLPYRCELVGRLGEWSIINDSKGTNMDSTLHALTNVNGKAILFLGGLGKGESFEEILRFKAKIGKIVAFGKSGQQVFVDLSAHIQTLCFPTLKEAIANFASILENIEGDILFSPACASQDEFRDYEERGHFFTSSVELFLKENKIGLKYEPISKLEKS